MLLGLYSAICGPHNFWIETTFGQTFSQRKRNWTVFAVHFRYLRIAFRTGMCRYWISCKF